MRAGFIPQLVGESPASFEDKWFLEFHSIIEACNQALQDLCSAYIVQPLSRQHHLFIAKTGGVHV
jgi:hypothetical protein